ncbi:hypothetical protein ACEYW6_24565 [Nostoc sp. UIC 10607]|uniref:hypothetical protein n=1 Tax=Nostoc sp. UIC 10607 TaxID=3045935 RepID=UPI0039A016ED
MMISPKIYETRVSLWTVNEYHRMFETVMITADERVELIEGQVIPITSTRSNNAVCV